MRRTKKSSATPLPQGEEFLDWRLKVDMKLKLDWKINLHEAGLSDDQITSYWKQGMLPDDFVEWYATKYDLYNFNCY